jgi:hypothetical protein
MFRRLLLPFVIALTGLLLTSLSLSAPIGLTRPLLRHCGDTLDPYCVCTWGEVLFRGQPVPGAVITMSSGSSVITNVTHFADAESWPYFHIAGYDLGARRGDLVTLTATFAGQTVTRVIRAWPDAGADGEQHIALSIVELGAGQPLITGEYTRALAVSDQVVWAGGQAGVISIELTSGISVAQTLPWSNSLVRALAIAPHEQVWAAMTEGLAEYDPGTHTWYSHTAPFSGVVRTLVGDTGGAIWAGGGDGVHEYLAVYTGTWTIPQTFSTPVTALAVDGENRVWVGTWGNGVYRKDGNAWTHYQNTDGLASNYVLAATADAHAVWFGTEPYLSGSGQHGGIARYDLTTGAWRTYTTAQGLPPDPLSPSATAIIGALSLDENGQPWAGTIDGVRFLVGEKWWAYTTTHGLRAGTIQALAVKQDFTVAAGPIGLDRIDRFAVSGCLPEAAINSVTPLTLTLNTTLTLSGTGWDTDENGARLIAWDWASSLDGPLCTTPSCTLPYGRLTPGDHVLAWRVGDDEGEWSAIVTRTVKVLAAWQVYLPLVVRQDQ